MSQYYNPRRTRNVFKANSDEPFRLSRSKIDLFLNCARCFYLDRRLGVGQPPGFPFSLNSAVDHLLKKEFDTHRSKGTPHPLMVSHGIEAVPFAHSQLDEWRDSLRRGITYHHPETNLVITGGVDDLWANPQGEIMVVDYKATSKDGEVSLDADWQIGYKRQMEIYQWLFRKNNFKVSPVGYFVYCNGQTNREMFDSKLEFTVKVIPYKGDDTWVEGAIKNAHACLSKDTLPKASPNCDFCAYFGARRDVDYQESLNI
ncbi:MAG: PD-(D/E)XK nuclease family protein [bacterium]|nr:PD-(D/E)XK nuclease family protein [bacterium]